jgi:hypothetical protein
MYYRELALGAGIKQQKKILECVGYGRLKMTPKMRDELLMDMQLCCMDDSVKSLQSGAEKRRRIAELMLSVVEQHIQEHIDEWVEICPVCLGTQFAPEEVEDYPCKPCKGKGIVLKGRE